MYNNNKPSNDGKDVAEDIGLGDGPVNITDDDLVSPLPKVDVTVAPRRPLKSRRHAELDLVGAALQVQLFLHKQMQTLEYQIEMCVCVPKTLTIRSVDSLSVFL